MVGKNKKKLLIVLIALSWILSPGRALAVETDVENETTVEKSLAVLVGGIVNETLRDHESMGVPVNREEFITYLTDYLNNKDLGMDGQQAKNNLNAIYRKVFSDSIVELSKADPAKEAAFMAEAAGRDGAVMLETGTIVETLKEGIGSAPRIDGNVEMRYTGSLSDGTVFDEVLDEEAPLDFTVKDLVPGLTEALTSGILKAGGKYRLTIPPTAAYGEEGVPGVIPPGSVLQFDIDIISVE